MRKIEISFLLVLALSFTSCKNINQMYNGEWHIIKADSDTQKLLDLGLDIEFNIDTEKKSFDIYTIIDGNKTLQNTGRIERATLEEYFVSYLPDKETGHKIHGTLKLVDGKLHYSTDVRVDWVFVK